MQQLSMIGTIIGINSDTDSSDKILGVYVTVVVPKIFNLLNKDPEIEDADEYLDKLGLTIYEDTEGKFDYEIMEIKISNESSGFYRVNGIISIQLFDNMIFLMPL